MLSKYCDDNQNNLDEFIDSALFAYRTSPLPNSTGLIGVAISDCIYMENAISVYRLRSVSRDLCLDVSHFHKTYILVCDDHFPPGALSDTRISDSSIGKSDIAGTHHHHEVAAPTEAAKHRRQH